MIYALFALIALLVVLIAVVVIRALMFRPYPEAQITPTQISVDTDKAVADLSAMIRCKTVSHKKFTPKFQVYPKDARNPQEKAFRRARLRASPLQLFSPQ